MDSIKPSTKKLQARVLVVDDHPYTALTLARAISQLGSGIEVITANSGELALELVRDRTVDLLITDMVMSGMNGTELIEKMQAHPGGRPAFTALITAYDVPGLRITAQRLNVNEVLIKPIRPERICQIVSKAIEDLGRTPITSPEPTAKPRPKILVADDLQDNVSLLTRYLENEGYDCIPAANGEEALAKMRSEIPDLALLDVNMPVKDGIETLQEIRTDPAINHIPVIILTAARIEPVDMQSALNMGADDYVTKPFDRRELLARIRTRLRVKESEDIIRQRNRELNLLPEIGRELSARLDIDELATVVLRRTVETLGALLGHIVIFTPKGPIQKSYCISTSLPKKPELLLPPLEPLLTLVKDTQQGFIINDTYTDMRWPAVADDPTRSAVVVPLSGRLDLLGLLILVHEKENFFSMEHKLLLQAIASQAAIAMENAQLYAKMTQNQEPLAVFFHAPNHAILVFDQEGCLIWLNPAGEKLFTSRQAKFGKRLEHGFGYDPLVKLLEAVRASGETGLGKFPWPDGRTFTALLTPMEDGGILALMQGITNLASLQTVDDPITAGKN